MRNPGVNDVPPEPAPRLRLAVDAANLEHDRRGMGRLARGVLRSAAQAGDVDVTLLADRRADRMTLAAEFPCVTVANSKSARDRRAYDVVWFPFNGMRYRVAAPALVSMNDAFAFTFPHRDPVARYREQAPMRRAARCAARILTLSQWARSELVRELGIGDDRTDIVPPTPDSFWSAGEADALPAALRDRRYVLLVGVTEPRKNARLALDACALALRAPNERLVIVGALTTRDREHARANGVPAGEIAASDTVLRALYRGAALVLVPSKAEGFGLVAIEALACGAPVIASKASALPEATAGAAVLLGADDRTGWAATIRNLLDDPERTAELRSRAAARFTGVERDRSSRETLALLRDVACGLHACGGS